MWTTEKYRCINEYVTAKRMPDAVFVHASVKRVNMYSCSGTRIRDPQITVPISSDWPIRCPGSLSPPQADGDFQLGYGSAVVQWDESIWYATLQT